METEDQEKEIRLCEEPIVLGKEEYFAGDGIDISDENVISIDKNVVQEKLTAGTGININEQNDISVDTDTIQEKLTAGNNINITEQNVISATDTTYTAGENINISEQNVISATDTKYTAGKNITISEQNVISAADGEVYTAGDNITIENNVISATDTTYTAGNAISIDSSDNNRIDADIHPADYFTADASELIADGSADGTIQATFKSVELYGDTTQQTYTGKNLFDPSVAANNKGLAWTSGNYTDSTGSVVSDYIAVTENTKIQLTYLAAVFFYDSSKNLIGHFGLNQQIITATGGGFYNSFTVPSGYSIAYIRICFRASQGTNPSDLVGLDIMVNTGDTLLPYEPFVGGVPAPNPDYPQDINVVTGTQTVTVTGKNLFDGILESGIINGNTGVNAPNANYVRAKNYIPVEELTNYTISSTNTAIENFNIYEYKADYTYNLTTNRVVAKGSYWQTSPGTKYIRFRPAYPSSDTTMKFQVELGTTPSAYEAYQGHNYTVGLGSLELAKIGTYQDYIYKSGDDWYVHKEIEKNEITSIFSIYSSAGDGYIGGIKNAPNMKANSRTNGFCDKLTPIYSPSGAVTEGITFGAGSTNRNIYIILKSSRIPDNTLEGWNTYLSSNPFTVYYPLETPIDTKITDTDLISDLNVLASGYTYADETNFTITATGTNIPAPMDFEVYKNSLAGMAEVLANKQDKLIAGSNINITGNVISALGGGSSVIQTLTTADYNWDSTGQGGAPNAVGAWLLSEGWYYTSDVETHSNTTYGPLYENTLLYVHHDDQDPDMITVFTISGRTGGFVFNYLDSNGDLTDRPYGIDIETIVLNNEERLPQYFDSAPTTADSGALGQLCTDTSTMHTYQCTAIDDSDPDNIEYTWTLRW